LYSVYDVRLQPAAVAVGGISVVSFITIALTSGGYNDLIRRVVIADVAALVFLVIAAALLFYRRRVAPEGFRTAQ
jgi:hypothetical protein